MVNLIMQKEHVSLIERKLKTQTRRLVKYQDKHPLPCQHKVNWRYWVCPAATWKLQDKFYQDLEQLKSLLNESEINSLIEAGELKRCRNAPGAFQVRTIGTNEKKDDFRLEYALSISPEDAVREGYESTHAYLIKFYEIYAKQGKTEAKKSLELLQEAFPPFDRWLKSNQQKLWNPLVRVIDFKFLPNTERDAK